MEATLGGIATLLGRLALACVAASTAAVLADPHAARAAGLRLPCAFEPGQSVGYRVEREREDVRGGRTSGGRGTYDVALEVVGREADGYLLRWRQKVAAVQPSAPVPPAARADVDALVAAANDLELVMRTDAKLTPRSLANEAEVRATVGAALDRLQALNRVPPEAREGTRRLLAVPGTLATLMLREPSLLLMLACADLAEDRTEYEDRLPNPFGGAPLQSRAVITVLNPGGETGASARIGFEQRLDPEAVRALIDEVARRAAGAGRALPPDAVPSFDIRDRATLEMGPGDGWPVRIEWSRDVAAGDARRTDRLVFARTGR
jgi:hypothetical protein